MDFDVIIRYLHCLNIKSMNKSQIKFVYTIQPMYAICIVEYVFILYNIAKISVS